MEKAADKYHALQEAALAITSDLSLDRVLKKIVDAARELAQARYAALGVADDDRKGLVQFVVSGLTDSQVAAIGPWPRGLGLLGALLSDPRPLRAPKIAADHRSIGFPPGHPAMTSFLGVPIISKGTILGNFYLTNKTDAEEFSADDEELIVALAAFAAVTIENARLYTETDAQLKLKLKALERAERRAKFLLELSALLPSGPLAEELPLREVLTRASAQLGDACAAYLTEPAGQLGRRVVVHRDPARSEAAERSLDELWEGISEQVLRKERVFFVANVDASLNPLPGITVQAMREHGFTAGLAVPIKSTKHVFGVFLSLASQPLTLSDGDFPFGQLVAARLGTALENASLLRELRRAVSARERSIAELRQSEEVLRQLSAAVEQSPSTDREGNLQYVKRKFTELTGYTAAEVVGQNPRLLKSGQTPPEEYRRMWDTIASGGTWRGHFLNKKKSGELYWEAASIAPITNAGGAITHYVAVKQDITERKAADAERERLLEAVQSQAAELDAIVESIADMVIIYDRSGRLARLNATAVRTSRSSLNDSTGRGPRSGTTDWD